MSAVERRAIACPSCGRATDLEDGYVRAHPTYTSIYCLASDLPLIDGRGVSRFVPARGSATS